MEFRLFIVLFACLSYLVPPSLGGLVGKAAAIGAAKGAIIGGIKGAAIGAGVGLAAKGAAALVTKKAVLKIILKAAALKGAALLKAKKAALPLVGSLAGKGLKTAGDIVTRLTDTEALVSEARISLPSFTTIFDIISGAASGVVQTLNGTGANQEKTSTVYRVISAPRLFAIPIEVVNL